MNLYVGTDIVYIPRLKKIITEKPSFIEKNYTEKEIFLAKQYKNAINIFATRFAAKEAIIKATNGMFSFKDIEILKGINGEPIPSIINHQEYEIKISLSYDNDYAIAFCLVQKK